MAEADRRDDVSLHALRLFVRIVERGSISKAAEDLGLSQPTASRRIQEIESAYKTKLLARTTRAMRVTDAGEQFLARARQILQADAAFRDRIGAAQKELSGEMHISAPSGLGSFVVAPFCGEFASRYPQVRLHLQSTDRFVDLVKEGIDIAIRIGRLADSSYYRRPLGSLEEVAVAHRALLTVPVRSPADLVSLPWIGFSGLQEGLRATFQRGGRSYNLKVRPRLLTDQIVAHREALLAGGGAGLIHRYAVDADIKAGRLVQLLPDWKLPLWPVHALSTARGMPTRFQRWREELHAWLETVPGVFAA